MLYNFLSYLIDKGHQIPQEAVLDFYREEFGDLPPDWSQDQKRNVRKEVVRVLGKLETPTKVNPDEVVEYLWACGWEYRAFRNQVVGLDKYVENWVNRMFPKEDLELVQGEATDPRLVEVIEILKTFYVSPSPRECRMILRNETPALWIRYACELFRAHGKPQSHYSIRNILQEADFRFANKDNRNCDSI
jgi:hypothetical protein